MYNESAVKSFQRPQLKAAVKILKQDNILKIEVAKCTLTYDIKHMCAMPGGCVGGTVLGIFLYF